MISFACSRCVLKFSVKDEFAGRSTRCPGCKNALIVPQLELTHAYVPQERIDGPPSSLEQAGTDHGVTLPVSSGKEQTRLHAKSAGRYLLEGEIARGGMGAVLRGVDRDLRREVAVKFMLHAGDPRQQARFIEEAQITGQLEHPNIVPIHELGIDAQKRLFFTMKMVKGKSLSAVLKELEMNSREAEKDWPLSRLVNVVIGVCHALAYAHSRRVIHRDLKPANIMMGDFGEVYVMDWGLAKVMTELEAVASSGPVPVAVAIAAGSVVTTRTGEETDLTQDGAILGTPAYMPPEQARGEINALDQRSDIYSLGAILYAVLTLQQPVEKNDNYLALLMSVAEGDIKPPEVRAPGRFIPPELSAIAMKALAKKPADRYQHVEELRRDVERYQEGRSVSAKRDTAWEMTKKFVKRNKGLSAGLALTFVVLLWALVTVSSAYASFRKEQREKDRRTREAIPAFLEAARQAIDKKRHDSALAQVNVALDYDADHAEALLLKGQLFVAEKRFADAETVLKRYVQRNPDDALAAKLAALCASPDTEAPGVQQEMGNVLVSQKQPMLAVGLFQGSDEQLALYRKRINDALPGLGNQLKLDKELRFSFYISGSALKPALQEKLLDLSPFQGIPLSTLRLVGLKTRDLGPLSGMPLRHLELTNFPFIKDLTPLRNMPLTYLNLDECGLVDDLSPLQGMPLTHLRVERCPLVKNLSPLRGMPLTHLELTSNVNYAPSLLEDITPLQGLPIQELALTACKVADLRPLRGMPLRKCNFHDSRFIKDLSPLQGMRLQEVDLAYTLVEDLTLFQGMPLTHLWLSTKIRDLTPLEGMSLEEIHLSNYASTYRGLDVLRAMKSLQRIGKYEAAEFWKKLDAGELK